MDLPLPIFRPGTRLAAEDVNRLVRAAQELDRNIQAARSFAPGAYPSVAGGVLVQVCNKTGDTLYPSNIAGMDDTVFTDTATSEPVIVNVVVPTNGDHPGRWVVLLEELPEDGVGRALMFGVALVQLDVPEEGEDYEYAELADGEVDHLNAVPLGSAEILWREEIESGSGSGEDFVWAVVRFPRAEGSSVPMLYRVTEVAETSMAAMEVNSSCETTSEGGSFLLLPCED